MQWVALVSTAKNRHVQLKAENYGIAERLLASKDSLCYKESANSNLHNSDDGL